MQLSIENFNPKKEELISLAESYKWLTIDGIEDKNWYETVKRARINLKEKRVQITKIWKQMREEAILFQKTVIEKEKEFVAIIEPIEEYLKWQEKLYDEWIEKEKRKKILPIRKEQLNELWIWAETYTEDMILSMDDTQFSQLLFEIREKIQLKKQQELEEAQKKLDEEKNRIEHEKEIERVRKETEANTEARIKKEQEEKNMKEKKAKEEKEKREQEQKERLERDERYNNWLKDNWYSDDEFIITTEDNKKIMWKKVSSFIF